MSKRLAWAAVAVVGVVGVAAWSGAQAPGDAPSAQSSTSGVKASGSSGSELLPPAKNSSALRIKPSTSMPSTSRSSQGASSASADDPRSPLTSSRSLPDLDASLAPPGGASSRSDLSRGSALPSGPTIHIDHALVTSLDPIKLPAREAGAIREITVKKGQEVKVDDVLGQLDDQDSQTKKKIAELERDAARIQAESNAQIEAAKKGEEVTRENYKANEELNKTKPGAISPFDFRRSWFEWQRALAQIAVAEVEKAVAQATQFAKEGQIDGALIEIEKRKIVAPIDGFVNDVYKHKGEWCQPGDPVLELVRMDRLEIEGFVYAENASPQTVLGKPVEVVVHVAGGETYKTSSTITFASPVLEGSGRIRQFRVSTEIDNKRVADDKGNNYWLIQPGSEAEMTILVVPPTPKPVSGTKTTSPAGTKAKSSGAIELKRPVVPDLGGKSEEKSETKGDAAKSESSKSEAGKTDSSKAEAKNGKSSQPDADKPAKDGDKEPARPSKIKL